MVTDVCPECSAAEDGTGDHFDLNALSFNQLAPELNGKIDVNYRLVACTPPSDIQVQVDGNDGVGLWLRLVITVSLLCPLLVPVLPTACVQSCVLSVPFLPLALSSACRLQAF